MSALPLYIFAPNDQTEFVDGALIRLPAELDSAQHRALYRRAPPGWHVCGLGYHFYASVDRSGTKYVIVGLQIEGERSPKRKLYFPPQKFARAQIEQLMKYNLAEREAARQDADQASREKEAELGVLVHDLRALSSAIYNPALEAKTELERGHYQECRTRIENILAIQTLLSIRIDGLDLGANSVLLTDISSIAVFRKIDKVVRCFRAKGTSRRLDIELTGSSFGTILGPNVFELIPFALIDNAIKYSPAGQLIQIHVEEDSTHIRANFRSIGPKIDADEIDRIFDKNYRGKFALATGTAGTGIGLSNVRKLVVEHFGGTIKVCQPTERFQIGLVPYLDTIFVLALPK